MMSAACRIGWMMTSLCVLESTKQPPSAAAARDHPLPPPKRAPELALKLKSQGKKTAFKSPTRVPAAGAASWRDAVVQAPTGSGKTLAYAVPLLTMLSPALEARRARGSSRGRRRDESRTTAGRGLLPTDTPPLFDDLARTGVIWRGRMRPPLILPPFAMRESSPPPRRGRRL